MVIYLIRYIKSMRVSKSELSFMYALLDSKLPFSIECLFTLLPIYKCQKTDCLFTLLPFYILPFYPIAFLPYCLFTLLPFYPIAKIQESLVRVAPSLLDTYVHFAAIVVCSEGPILTSSRAWSTMAISICHANRLA